MKIGILGYGEVGKALDELYKENNIKTVKKDKTSDTNPHFKGISVLNVCIPYDYNFINDITVEIERYNPELTIIHSTVPVGVSKRIAINSESNVVHSPVIGSHPFLKESLKAFVKYIGSNDKKALKLAKKHFKKLKIKTKSVNSFSETETAKLLCTSYYGMCIVWHDYINNVCKKNNTSFEFIKEWNLNYNKGYKKLGFEKFTRPILEAPQGGKIGGHCIIPNAKLLNNQFHHLLLDELLKYE